MSYRVCKCGMKLNDSEVTDCPICEDIVKNKDLRQELIDLFNSEETDEEREEDRKIRMKRYYWREAQREHRRKLLN